MRKKLIIFLVVFICVISLALVGATGILYVNHVALPGQHLNGEEIAYQDIEECLDSVSRSLPTGISVKFTGITMTLSIESFAERIDVKPKQTFKEWLHRENIVYKPHYVVEKSKLKDVLRKRKHKSTNAYILCNLGYWNLIPDKQGTDYKISDLAKAIEDAIEQESYDIDGKPYMIPATITTEQLQPLYNKVSWLNDFSIRYSRDCEIIGTDLSEFVDKETYELNVPDKYLSDFISELNKTYATTGGELSFKTHAGKYMTIPYNTFGKQISIDKETQFIKSAIENHTSEINREPEMYGYDIFGDTYMEVSLSEQRVWHYVNGAVCCESDCVTGRKNIHDTPTGVFYVSEKIPGKYLVGTDNSYRTWVDKWMRLTNGGVGFHDATWRRSFGKQIYIYNGSHGCINLPYSYAAKLYDEIERGIPTVIY